VTDHRRLDQRVDRDPETVPVAAPPRVAAWVANAPDGPLRVLHACAETVYLDVLGRAVGVGAADCAKLPNTLRTNLSTLSSLAVPTAYLDSGLLNLDGRVLVTRRLVDVRAPRLDTVGMPRTSPVAASGNPRPRGAGLVALESWIDAGRIDAGTVPDLVGRGGGLTPLGDDVLCGWLAAHRAAGVATPGVDDAVRRALPRTTTLSATLLECALAGEVADLVAAYLRNLGSRHAAAARTALAALGHSSGGGLAHGIDLAVAELVGREAA
jgi:hypothetical protein